MGLLVAIVDDRPLPPTNMFIILCVEDLESQLSSMTKNKRTQGMREPQHMLSMGKRAIMLSPCGYSGNGVQLRRAAIGGSL